jgi:hypothetical protein
VVDDVEEVQLCEEDHTPLARYNAFGFSEVRRPQA